MAGSVIDLFKNEYTTSCSGLGAVNLVEAASYAPGYTMTMIKKLYLVVLMTKHTITRCHPKQSHFGY
eukprot:2227039-Ditylum_brightwellii.AAC.1